MKSVRPQLAVTTGVFATLQVLVGIVSLVLCAIALDTVTAWGLGGSIGLVVVGLLGMVGGFGRFKWMITLYSLLNLVAIGFTLVTVSLLWRQSQVGPGLIGYPVALSAMAFIACVFAFFGSITGFAAVASRRRDVATTAPAWQVEEKSRKRVIGMNRTVLAFAILQMITAIPALVMGAIDGTNAGWWTFGGCVGLVFASLFGIIAGVRARRGMHLLYALLSLTAVGFTLVGVGIYFQVSNLAGIDSLNALQKSTSALGFVAATFGFFGAVVSIATVFSYRRRLLPVATAHPTAATVAVPTVVVGEEAPGISPRAQPAQQMQAPVVEARPDAGRFSNVPAPAAPLATRV
jgi:hypothetical protein